MALLRLFVGASTDGAGSVAGVAAIGAGPGISITGTGTNPIVNNIGVLSVGAGTGISLTGTAAAPIVNNTGVLAVSAGTGISLTGTAANPVVNNTGVLAVGAGAGGITITGSASNPVVNATNTLNLLELAFGFSSTPGPLISTGAVQGMRPWANTQGGAPLPYRIPIALSDIEVWVNVVTFVDAGLGGSMTITLLKNGALSGKGIVFAAIGMAQLSGGPVAYAAGDTFAIQISVNGTVGVLVDFTVSVRGII